MTHTTDAAVLFHIGEPLRLIQLDIPPLRHGQVLVDVAYSGVCHSQLNEIEGKRGPDRFLPHTLGHEGSGTIIDIGDGVTKVKAGDRVVLTWLRGTGADVPSTQYGAAKGPVNSGAISTFLRHAVTCESRVVPIPGTIPLREAALLGCAVPTGGGIVRNTMNISHGQSIAVFGVGGVGMSAIAIAAMQHASMIVAVDVSDERLEHARATGATHSINASREDPVAAIQKISGSKGVDFAIEAAGVGEVMEAAFKSVRDAGGLCVLAGNVAHGETISIDPFDLIRGKQVRGSRGGESNPDEDIAAYAALYAEKRLQLGELTGQTYPLERINDALANLAAGAVGRSMIDMSIATESS